jgi:hypothetical protein
MVGACYPDPFILELNIAQVQEASVWKVANPHTAADN